MCSVLLHICYMRCVSEPLRRGNTMCINITCARTQQTSYMHAAISRICSHAYALRKWRMRSHPNESDLHENPRKHTAVCVLTKILESRFALAPGARTQTDHIHPTNTEPSLHATLLSRWADDEAEQSNVGGECRELIRNSPDRVELACSSDSECIQAFGHLDNKKSEHWSIFVCGFFLCRCWPSVQLENYIALSHTVNQ